MRSRLALASTAVVLVAAVIVYFMTRSPPAEPPSVTAVEPQAADGELVGAASAGAATEAVRRDPIAEESPDGVAAATATHVLRVVVEGDAEEDARRATVTVMGRGVDTRGWRDRIQDSWSARGSTSEFDLDPFFARVAERFTNLRDDLFVVEVDHPLCFRKRIQVPLSDGVEDDSGQTVYEIRVPLVPPTLWPEFSLAVRDAHTREHLEDVELRCVTTALMGVGQNPGPSGNFTLLGDDLESPITLRGGHETDDPEHRVAGMALSPVSGAASRLITLGHNGRPRVQRGLVVFARAPGYAWGKIIVDVSTSAAREILLGPEAALGVRLANVQAERYAELGLHPLLTVGQPDPSGGAALIWHQNVDAALETEGLRLKGLEPGEFDVKVELSPGWQKRPTALAREEFSLAAGEDRELLVTLADPPGPPVLANLGGVVSFPSFGGEDDVRLEIFRSDYRYGDPDHELSLAELEPVAAALPTWSFHLANLPVDRYQFRLRPFLKSWMIELPASGREDVELVIPELAEVRVETVDAQTGQRIPVESIAYKTLEVLPDQVTHGGSPSWSVAGFEGEPGSFRFWATPGAMHVTTRDLPSGLDYGNFAQELELVHGLQSVRLELALACTIRIEFRVDGAALPYEDSIFYGLSRGFRAVGHDGRVGGMYPYSLFEASAPGPYEISFEGVGTDRFLPIPPRRVDALAGETTVVIVELHRK